MATIHINHAIAIALHQCTERSAILNRCRGSKMRRGTRCGFISGSYVCLATWGFLPTFTNERPIHQGRRYVG